MGQSQSGKDSFGYWCETILEPFPLESFLWNDVMIWSWVWGWLFYSFLELCGSLSCPFLLKVHRSRMSGLQRKSNRSPKSLELCRTRGSGEIDSECLRLTEEALHALALA